MSDLTDEKKKTEKGHPPHVWIETYLIEGINHIAEKRGETKSKIWAEALDMYLKVYEMKERAITL